MTGLDPNATTGGEDPKEAMKRLARMLRDVGFGPNAQIMKLLGPQAGMMLGGQFGGGGMMVPPIGGGGFPGIPGIPGLPGVPGVPGGPGTGGGSGGSGGTGCSGGECYDESPPEGGGAG